MNVRASSLGLLLLVALHQGGLAQNYDEQIQAFLDLLPDNILEDAEAVQEIVQQFMEDPVTVAQSFVPEDFDLSALGIDATPTNSLEDGDTTAGGGIEEAVGGLFQLGADLLGGFGGGGDNSDDSQKDSPVEKPDDYDYTKDVLTFDADHVFTNISLNFGMDEIAAYFGVDKNNPEELDNFVNSFGSCEFCDTHDIDPNLKFLGFDCSDILMFSLFSKEEECSILRVIAMEHCGCKAQSLQIRPTTPKCDLCEDGSLEGVVMEKRIPAMSDELSCENITNVPAVEGSKTCDAVASFGYICGCPTAEPQCHLCPDASVPPRRDALLNLPGPNVMTKITKAKEVSSPDPEVEDLLTCAAFADQLNVKTRSTCPTAIHDLEKEIGLAIPSYCGCPNAMGPEHGGCDPCPNGFQLKENLPDATFPVIGLPTPATTCEDWALHYAPNVLDSTMCNPIQRKLRRHCCEVIPRTKDTDEMQLVNSMNLEYPTSSAASAQSVDTLSSIFAAPVPLAIILVVAFVR